MDQNYLDVAQRAWRFFLSCHQWDGVKQSDVENWLENFPDPAGQYYALRLLNNLLYYSEADMEHLLKEGVQREIIGKEVLLEKQVPAGFQLSDDQLKAEAEVALGQTLFIPLLDKGAPYESGNQISRMLVHRLSIPTSQVAVVEQISDTNCGWVQRVIIVDDCVGSGDQLRDFWYESTTADGTLLSQWCNDRGIRPYYLVLVGYHDTISRLGRELPELTINCMELLREEHRVFGPSSVFWQDAAEMRKAREYLTKLTLDQGISLLGHKNLDFAVIMHKNIPDWSLPLLWKYGQKGWTVLMQRKDSRA